MNLRRADAPGIAAAAGLLRQGEVVAYPTETIYGLGADPFNPEALQRLLDIKGRDAAKGVILIVGEPGDVERVAAEVSGAARRLMDAFWPGPVTLLVPAHPSLPAAVTGGRPRVAVRCPGHDVARDLCRAFGGPVTSTSANRSGEPPAIDLAVLELPGVALGLDAGPLPPSEPSTLVDPDSGEVLRQGAVPAALVREALRGTA